MSGPTFLDAKKELTTLLGTLLARSVKAELPKGRMEQSTGIDLILRAGEYRFLVFYRQRALAEDIKRYLHRLSEFETSNECDILTLAVPFMTNIGSSILRKEAIAWFDLSGNAEIIAPNLRILVDGKPNRFPEPRRSPDLFARKSARISRWLLIHYPRWHSQREITSSAGVSNGLTSRICSRLKQAGFIERRDDGKLRAANPDDLLETWKESYQFSDHRVLKAHLSTRDGPSLSKSLASKLSSSDIRFALTGLSAAWIVAPIANFRIVTAYIEGVLADQLVEELGGREVKEGGNLWLVAPNDSGVFDGMDESSGIPTVHPVQVYLDLKGHPERAEEAAAELKRTALRWKSPNGS